MLTAAINGLVARPGIGDEYLGVAFAGAVLKHSRDLNLTCECVPGFALTPDTPVFDI